MAERVVDADEVLRNLEKLDKAAQGQVLQLAALAGAKPITNGWKDNIIGWPLVKTGTYHRAVHEQVFAAESSSDRVVVVIGPDINDPPYPFFLEYGTSKMAPKPVGRKAFDENSDEAQREFGEVLWALIQKELR